MDPKLDASMIDFDMEQDEQIGSARIKVIGVGGGGNNAVKRMIEANLTGVGFYAVNTDLQALTTCHNAMRVQIGATTTQGLGAGANPEKGRVAADEDRDKLKAIVEGADMVFVTAGMGGGTGTGAAPIIAGLAREAGALTIGVVTRPFLFEGRRRGDNSIEGLEEIRENTDSVIVIPNERLIEYVDQNVALRAAFSMVDEVLLNAVQSISDLITIPGEINLDFADVQTVMEDSGSALMGIGRGAGDSRAQVAAQNAISSPLLEESSISGATGIIVNLTGPSHMAMQELNDAMDVITAESDTDNIIFGLTYDDNLSDDEINITVIATGFEHGSSYNQDTSADVRDSSEFLGRFGQSNRFSDRSRHTSRDSRDSRDSHRSRPNSRRDSRFNRRSFDRDQANQPKSNDDREFASAPASETLDLPEMMRTQEPARQPGEQANQNRPNDVGTDIEIPTWLRINKDD